MCTQLAVRDVLDPPLLDGLGIGHDSSYAEHADPLHECLHVFVLLRLAANRRTPQTIGAWASPAPGFKRPRDHP